VGAHLLAMSSSGVGQISGYECEMDYSPRMAYVFVLNNKRYTNTRVSKMAGTDYLQLTVSMLRSAWFPSRDSTAPHGVKRIVRF
jgi:meiotically up-regulated gene 157 (Mug157) protein